jgi:glycosyltransferase involved in cell wall biosynthesis|tara:strand:- start:315 stop:1409 length:1095 start_codon:yes stop_codon:yes gene_type:complete
MNSKLITIIIPVRNEQDYIENCLDSINNFEIPINYKYEILIIDGKSSDKTLEKVLNYKNKNKLKNINIYNNENITQAFALNLGIKKANGSRILRLDAHCTYPKNYLALLIETSERTNAENIGGIIITKPGAKNYSAQLVQAITSHSFGVGNSGFRIGIKEGKVDTVPFGFFKKELFEKIGLFDTRLLRAQDYEFNRRITKNGYNVWLNPAINAIYYNQKSIIQFYIKQFFKEAPYNAYMWYLAPYTFAVRHMITLFFSLGFLGGLMLSPISLIIKYIFYSVMLLYTLLAFFSAAQQSIKYKKITHFFILPISFFLYHFIHGLGVIIGLLKLIFRKAPVQNIHEPWEAYGEFRVKIKNKNIYQNE